MLQVIQRSKITRVDKYALAKVKNPKIKHTNSEDGKNYLSVEALLILKLILILILIQVEIEHTKSEDITISIYLSIYQLKH